MFNLRKRHEPEQITPEANPTPQGGESSPDVEEGRASGAEAVGALKHFEKMHHLDPNLPIDELNDVDAAIHSSNPEKGLEVEQALIEDNSPYPEVSSLMRPEKRLLTVNRFALRSATTTRRCRPTQSEPGSSAWCFAPLARVSTCSSRCETPQF